MRGYGGYNRRRDYDSKPDFMDRIFSVGSYVTCGLFGFIWFIIANIQGKALSNFLKFHIFQSIMVTLLLALLNMSLGLFIKIIKFIPIIGGLVINYIYMPIFNNPFVLGYSIIEALTFGLAFYLIITAFLGGYSNIPGVSVHVRKML